MLEQFWRHLKRRDIYADASTRWRDPQARLLEGEAWTAVRGDVLTTLQPARATRTRCWPSTSRALDAAYRDVAGRLAASTEVASVDDGKIHLHRRQGDRGARRRWSTCAAGSRPCCPASTCPR